MFLPFLKVLLPPGAVEECASICSPSHWSLVIGCEITSPCWRSFRHLGQLRNAHPSVSPFIGPWSSGFCHPLWAPFASWSMWEMRSLWPHCPPKRKVHFLMVVIRVVRISTLCVCGRRRGGGGGGLGWAMLLPRLIFAAAMLKVVLRPHEDGCCREPRWLMPVSQLSEELGVDMSFYCVPAVMLVPCGRRKQTSVAGAGHRGC